jgi:hypothetical protein
MGKQNARLGVARWRQAGQRLHQVRRRDEAGVNARGGQAGFAAEKQRPGGFIQCGGNVRQCWLFARFVQAQGNDDGFIGVVIAPADVRAVISGGAAGAAFRRAARGPTSVRRADFSGLKIR